MTAARGEGPTAGGTGRGTGDPVQDQLEAYNRGDVEAFLRCYTGDAVITDETGAVRMRGREQMRERYTRRLASPGLHCTVAQRLVAGDWTVDHELLTGYDGGDAEALVAYRTGPDGRIERVLLLSSAATGPRAGVTAAGGGLTAPAQGGARPYDGDPVEDQRAARDSGDVEAFLRCFTDDAVVTDETGAVRLRGQDQLRTHVSGRPASPGPHAPVAQRLVGGGWTIDQEQQDGAGGGGGAGLLAAYRTGADHRIERLLLLSSP